MREFDITNECYKCGFGEAAVKYSPPWCLGVVDGVLKFEAPKMVRTCSRCGHAWYERPLDAEKDSE